MDEELIFVEVVGFPGGCLNPVRATCEHGSCYGCSSRVRTKSMTPGCSAKAPSFAVSAASSARVSGDWLR
jgi:hypothetical protein